MTELTARTDDEGWETVFSEWLKVSRLTANDMVFIFSGDCGNLEKNVSPNLVFNTLTRLARKSLVLRAAMAVTQRKRVTLVFCACSFQTPGPSARNNHLTAIFPSASCTERSGRPSSRRPRTAVATRSARALAV